MRATSFRRNLCRNREFRVQQVFHTDAKPPKLPGTVNAERMARAEGTASLRPWPGCPTGQAPRHAGRLGPQGRDRAG